MLETQVFEVSAPRTETDSQTRSLWEFSLKNDYRISSGIHIQDELVLFILGIILGLDCFGLGS